MSQESNSPLKKHYCEPGIWRWCRANGRGMSRERIDYSRRMKDCESTLPWCRGSRWDTWRAPELNPCTTWPWRAMSMVMGSCLSVRLCMLGFEVWGLATIQVPSKISSVSRAKWSFWGQGFGAKAGATWNDTSPRECGFATRDSVKWHFKSNHLWLLH